MEGGNGMKDLISYIAKALVDQLEQELECDGRQQGGTKKPRE